MSVRVYSRVFRDPKEFEEERLRGGVREFRCEICQERYPMRLMKMEDGHRVCTVNCDSKMTRNERDRQTADAAKLVAQKTRSSRPGPFPPGSQLVGEAYLRTVQWSGGARPYSTVEISRGSPVPVAVTLVGEGFTATNVTLTYEGGIAEASAPVVVSAQEITLSLECPSLSIPRGLYGMTFNENVWKDVFRLL